MPTELRAIPPRTLLSLLMLASSTAGSVAAQAPDQRTEAPAAEAAAQTSQSQRDDEGEFATFDLKRAVVSESGGLTAEEAGKRARSRSPRIAAARAQAASAGWDAETAWTSFLPQLQGYGQYKRVNQVKNSFGSATCTQAADPTGIPTADEIACAVVQQFPSFTQPVNQWALGATVKYPVSDLFLRAWPAYKGAKGVEGVQGVQVQVAESLVDVEARTAFYDYARASAAAAVAAQAVRQAEAQARQIQLFVDAGTAAPVDGLTARARLEQARGAAARADGNLAALRSRLAVLTGMERAEVGPIGEPVLEAPAFPTSESDVLVKRAIEQRPELRALRKVIDATDLTRLAQRNAGLPQLVLEGGALHAQPNPRYFPPNTKSFKTTWEVGASVVWSPNNSLVGYQGGRKVESTIAKARADLATQEDAVRIEVVTAHEDLKSALAAAKAAESQLGAAEEAYRVRLAMYRVGAGVIVDLLDADFAVTQARLEHANAAIGARAALANLQRVAVLD
jgi:outer membrane protein TolC